MCDFFFFNTYGMQLCVMLGVTNEAHKSLESFKMMVYLAVLTVTKCIKGLLTNWKGFR